MTIDPLTTNGHDKVRKISLIASFDLCFSSSWTELGLMAVDLLLFGSSPMIGEVCVINGCSVIPCEL